MTGHLQTRATSHPLAAVLCRLRADCNLSATEEALIRGLGEHRERRHAGEELVAEGQVAAGPRLLVSGWASCQRILPDGRRQIFGFALPGDGIGLREPAGSAAHCAVMALTPLELVDAEPLVEAVRSGEAPGLAQALNRARFLDDALLYDHMVRLGRQTAYERVAHFLLELQTRLGIAGIGDGQRFPLPLTQEVLADVLGLSIVHVNRTLQQLRREKLIELRSGVAILLQPETLANIADYRPTGAPALRR